MDLVCGLGNDMLTQAVTSAVQQIDSRTKYEVGKIYGFDTSTVDRAIKWAESNGQKVTFTNLPNILRQFQSFLQSRQGAGAGTSINAGVVSRDAYFQRIGWTGYAEYQRWLRDGMPSTIKTKADALKWAKGQGQISTAMYQSQKASKSAHDTNFRTTQKNLQDKALADLGLSTPKSLLPIAIAGVGAFLLLK